ncbi:hypothetical protein CH249_01975 [Rhodococcus sp. 05-2255-3B1]|uniref:hypothetical protein n=1 Tax=unclassified Rhodococcus (in: high G+C Gram-positive bacteria) TaxID=192944 RepID=UPI000B9A3DF6|nr:MULTISPECIES: hypothetical protein [unclassified Rhodococcus (in: high G+C Gram-positive bacteria)]OZE13349.1 hypothetical protein CH250_05390 [Rhodococcus sp. 05-2255-3C]OZE16039.1 hypothetical protein CH249_01975 [Rhodococcus sp. 05-2255-3B1]OZE19079.1 hypothetical protein CH255_14000 [Rhodococcus sp. 05-2255-2A2]
MTDHLEASLDALNNTDISSSLAHGQAASVQALRAIDGRLDALVEIATHAVGVLLDGRDVEANLSTDTTFDNGPVPFTPVPDPAAARAHLIEQLAEHLEATYMRITVTPHWPILAEAALEWMEKNRW